MQAMKIAKKAERVERKEQEGKEEEERYMRKYSIELPNADNIPEQIERARIEIKEDRMKRKIKKNNLNSVMQELKKKCANVS